MPKEQTTIEILPKKEIRQEIDTIRLLTEVWGLDNLQLVNIAALNIIETGHVPPSAISTRPGYPNEIPYISHVYAKRVMRYAFRWLYDYKVVSYQIHDDGSVSTLNFMRIKYPKADGTYEVQEFQEVGVFEAYIKTKRNSEGDKVTVNSLVTGKPEFTMSTADRVAASASRGFVRLLETAFGIGLELKEQEQPMTATDAWNNIRKMAERKFGFDRDTVISLFKKEGFSRDDLITDFPRAYKILYDTAFPKEAIPTDL